MGSFSLAVLELSLIIKSSLSILPSTQILTMVFPSDTYGCLLSHAKGFFCSSTLNMQAVSEMVYKQKLRTKVLWWVSNHHSPFKTSKLRIQLTKDSRNLDGKTDGPRLLMSDARLQRDAVSRWPSTSHGQRIHVALPLTLKRELCRVNSVKYSSE